MNCRPKVIKTCWEQNYSHEHKRISLFKATCSITAAICQAESSVSDSWAQAQQLAVSAAVLGRISRGLRRIRSGLRVSSSMFRPQTRLRSLPNKARRELTGWLRGHPVFTLRAGGSWSLPALLCSIPALAAPRQPGHIGAARRAKPLAAEGDELRFHHWQRETAGSAGTVSTTAHCRSTRLKK